MRVRTLSQMAGPDGNYAPGTVIEVNQAIGIRMVQDGAATYVDLITSRVIDPIETAAVEIPEAMETTGKRRGRPRKG